MEEKIFDWLKKEKLFGLVEKNHKAFEKVFTQCLDVKKEKVLLIGDYGFPAKRAAPIMLGCYAMVAKELGIQCDIVMQEPKQRGMLADKSVVSALLDSAQGSIILLSLSGKLGSLSVVGKSFRKFAAKKGYRFASTLNLSNLKTDDFFALVNAIDIDYDKMWKRAEKLKKVLDKASVIRVTTEKGTDFTYAVNGMDAVINTGNFKEPGTGGNIPAGEVYVPCYKDNVKGKVVIDGSVAVREGTLLVEEPVILNIEKGAVTKIKGGVAAELLEETLHWAQEKAKYPWGVRRIGELGIGLNPGAEIVGPTVLNEKAHNTAHVAIGSNAWFGGSIYAIIHLDHVFREPKFFVDGKPLDY